MSKYICWRVWDQCKQFAIHSLRFLPAVEFPSEGSRLEMALWTLVQFGNGGIRLGDLLHRYQPLHWRVSYRALGRFARRHQFWELAGSSARIGVQNGCLPSCLENCTYLNFNVLHTWIFDTPPESWIFKNAAHTHLTTRVHCQWSWSLVVATWSADDRVMWANLSLMNQHDSTNLVPWCRWLVIIQSGISIFPSTLQNWWQMLSPFCLDRYASSSYIMYCQVPSQGNDCQACTPASGQLVHKA